ncbi:hypothetical protein [Candidatus Albibeggiatoa sp. nov. BB20]|uniref:hypothetical protein n=1 Tax=Candidatus Albibeggiatoa sp. nov. BB20 TaxID=3162723 RepID=UPI0033659E74
MNMKYYRFLVLISLVWFNSSVYAANGCGADGSGLLVPDGPFPFVSYFDAFATYESACNLHDVCYEDGNQSQRTCDDEFLGNLIASCQSYPSLLQGYCEQVAFLYHDAVSQFGETSKTGIVSGEILQVNARRIDSFWGDDEFEACVTFRNNGVVNTEYDLILYSKNGDLIDNEPDFYEINVKVGDTATECVGTSGIYPSISDLGSTYSIVLRVDHPKYDLIEVDQKLGNTP